MVYAERARKESAGKECLYTVQSTCKRQNSWNEWDCESTRRKSDTDDQIQERCHMIGSGEDNLYRSLIMRDKRHAKLRRALPNRSPQTSTEILHGHSLYEGTLSQDLCIMHISCTLYIHRFSNGRWFTSWHRKLVVLQRICSPVFWLQVIGLLSSIQGSLFYTIFSPFWLTNSD